MIIEKIDNAEGKSLKKTIYSNEGRVILSEGAYLSSRIVERLKGIGVKYVYVDDIRTEDIVVENIISDENKQRSLAEISRNFKDLIDNKTNKILQKDFGKTFSILIEDIIYEVLNSKSAMISLVDIHSSDDYLFHHSLNVGIISTAIGEKVGLNMSDLKQLGIGGILHDIGKTKIPNEVLFKPGKLNNAEWEEMKKHTLYGFEIIKNQPEFSLKAAHAALQHHEKVNGEGYPLQNRGDKIELFGRIAALGDVYDALTSSRVYKNPMLPHEAYEVIIGSGGSHFDLELVKKFKEIVAVYPIGMRLKLSNGCEGVVSKTSRVFPDRPTIRVLEEDGISLSSTYEIDLSEKNYLDVSIVSVG